jgi:choline dehydrogenase-like flavoprotein
LTYLIVRTIKSPQILELSGVGRREVLSKIGVDVKVELPGVGENVQDHTYLGVSFELSSDVKHETFDQMRDPAYAAAAMKLQYVIFTQMSISICNLTS